MMNKKQYVSVIFEKKPQQMGLRGDPYFWDDLTEYFSVKELPYSEESLINDIYSLFQEATGEPLTTQSNPFVEKYAQGGMSSGCLCGAFWVEEAIPLIVKRYRKVTAKKRLF